MKIDSSVTNLNTAEQDIFGLSLIPVTSAFAPAAPPPLSLPDLPPELLSPEALVVMLGLGAGAILIGTQPAPPARKPHKDAQDRDLPDNKQVLKVFDAVEIVEQAFFTPSPVFGNLLIRAIGQIAKGFFDIHHGHWAQFSDLEKQSDEIQRAIFGPLADEIEKKFREAALQQRNDRNSGVWLERTVKRVKVGGAGRGKTVWEQSVGSGFDKPARRRVGKLHAESGHQDV